MGPLPAQRAPRAYPPPRHGLEDARALACRKKERHLAERTVSPLTLLSHTRLCRSAEMMGNAELAPEVDVSTLEPLLSADVVSELLNTYMSTLTVSRAGAPPSQASWWTQSRSEAAGGGRRERPVLVLASEGCVGWFGDVVSSREVRRAAGFPAPGGD